MQQTSELYRQLLADGNHVKRHRFFVDGLEYGHSEILRSVEVVDVLITQPPEVTGELFADGKPGVGGCVAKQLDIVFLPREEPPRMAEMILETQLVLLDPATGTVTAESEWVPQGGFYIDTRKSIDLQDPDYPLGALQVHGYDAMLQLEDIYLRDGKDLTAVPTTMPEMAADIAARIGTVIDPRTQLKPYAVSPPFGYTMREIMGWIAAAHGGNWILTGTGEFLLRPLAGIPAEDGFLQTEDGDDILLGTVRLVVSGSDTGGKGGDETYVGRSACSLTTGKQFAPYTGVTLWYDDEAAFRAGDDTGRMLEADCIWATQAMADAVLEAVRGFRYRPFAATGATVDPAAELGDGVTVGGVYSVLASMATIYDAVTASDIAAPGEEEVDSEYPYTPPETRQLQRKLTLGKDYYGVRFTRQKGFEVVNTAADGTEKARALLNSDVLAFYDANGREALYFDAAAGKYRFRGDVEITGGTMNVNNNFIVDEYGNLTINGNINLSNGTITWGGNAPESGGISASEAKTIITNTLVSAPTIMGAEIYGGMFSSVDSGAWLTIEGEGGAGSYYSYLKYNTGSKIAFGIDTRSSLSDFDPDNGGSAELTMTAFGMSVLKTFQRPSSGEYYTAPQGHWDFSDAHTTGIVPVWG